MGIEMPYVRMDSALFTANTECSTPQQFLLSWDDFKAFVAGQNPNKSSQGSPPNWFYGNINVVQATGEATNSRLHVLGTRPIFTDPIIF